ncbi:MAG TPA: UvrD-helicase domain-containing protein [Solirubrobacteraceae bacterium]
MTAGAIPLQPLEFDPCGELPRGVTVLEASAGTGKTYTIAALTARYVAEGIDLERLLLVTFTRIATGELRERVRERLVSVERGLTRRLAGAPPPEDEDPVVTLLARENAQRHRENLARAIASFDAATIATTHGFCQEMLGGLGIAGDLEPDVTFVEDLSDLVDDVVDDLYIRRFAPKRLNPDGTVAFGRAEAGAIARAAIDNPSARIISDDSEVPRMRLGLADAARREFEARKRSMMVMTYDDLVERLKSALAGPGGAAVAAQLRARYEVVLVDEFQDTDPAQWEILRLAFGQGPTHPATLVLIADPKQAIYAFRGADVYAYLEAARAAGTQATLPINWRSDQGLIDAHDALFSGVKLGHEGIAYRQVRAADAHQAPGLAGAPVAAPLRVRVALRTDVPQTPRGYARAPDARRHVVCDVAADIVELLASGARVAAPGDRRNASSEVVQPGHVAVLVRTNKQAAMIREALEDVGVPAVINGAGSVFGTEPARQWLRLLEALERPASIARAHSAALTAFVGWSAERLAQADDDSVEWEDVHRRLHEWARVLRTRGVASLLETVMRDASTGRALAARALGEAAGERSLTDLRHIGQLLHTAASEEQLGPTALTAWLRTRIAEAEIDTADEERSRRLESDAEAVQVLTIHRSKGLEFPVVYLPFLWESGYIPDKPPRPVFFHDPEAADERTVDVALEGSDFAHHREQFIREQRGEDLRLAYVALTRARHQAVVWWAGSYDSRDSPLGRLLFARSDNGDVEPSGGSVPSDQAVVNRFRSLADATGGQGQTISVERSELTEQAVWRPERTQPSELDVAAFARDLDLRWRRTSYSDITAASHEDWVTSEPEQPLLADEPIGLGVGPTRPTAPAVPEPAPAVGDATELALSSMPAGVDVGTFVHRVMEASDFAAPDLDAELAARIADVQGRRAVDVGPSGALAAGLRAVIETPLGPVLGDRRLRDIARGDRLDELGFELPLAGGDQPSGWLTLRRIAAVLRAHTGPADPLAGYAERLDDARLRQSVRGYLTGSLDLVVRIPDPAGAAQPRFAVLDYKTNWLGAPDEPLTTAHYRHEAMAGEMLRHHYALQALLYAVALHRFLRWRLPGYDPEVHLAGVVYLFVRGMTGADGPLIGGTPTGVFGWPAPPGLVPALSDALDEGDAA